MSGKKSKTGLRRAASASVHAGKAMDRIPGVHKGIGTNKADLRREAGGRLKSGNKPGSFFAGLKGAALIHELEVHQAELEMQNEELQEREAQLERSRNRYASLYDFAPVGYFTFDKKKSIIEANMTAADMLGIERGHFLRRQISRFIADGFQDAFHRHCERVFAEGASNTARYNAGGQTALSFPHSWKALFRNRMGNAVTSR